MSMLRALALLGAGAQGFVTGLERAEEEKRRQKNQDHLDKQRERESSMQADIQAAQKPVQVEAVQQADSMDMDQPGSSAPSNMVNVGFKAGGKDYADRPSAEAAAAGMNSPEAVSQRVGQAISKYDPMKGLQFQNASMEAMAAQQKMADQQFIRGGIKSLITGDWQGFADYLSQSPADGQGGSMKFTAIASPDGKTTRIAIVDQNGQPTSQGMDFSNDQEGHMRAISMLMSLTSPEDRMKHYQWEREMALRAGQANDDSRYRDRMATVAERNAQTNESYRKDLIRVRDEQASSSAPAFERMSEADKFVLNGAQRTLDNIEKAIVEAQASQMWNPESPNAKSLMNQRAVAQAKIDRITSRYATDQPSAEDPLGMRKRGAAESRGSRPSSGRGEMVDLSPQSDQIRIIQDELNAAIRDGRTEDENALRRELSRLGVKDAGVKAPPNSGKAKAAHAPAPAAGAASAPTEKDAARPDLLSRMGQAVSRMAAPSDQNMGSHSRAALASRTAQAVSRMAAPSDQNMESHAQSALASGDKRRMSELLAITDAAKPMSEETRRKLEAAVKTK